MATCLPQRDGSQSSDGRDSPRGARPVRREVIHAEHRFDGIIGHSAALTAVLAQLELVAPTDATVLLLGETGTGKELLARALHTRSARHARPFITLNCAAIPTGLLESELFGHEKGAFTGAMTQRLGRCELANGGTLFLDEIGDLPLELQPKLLRVLQDHAFERLGSARTLHTDVRVVAATHRDLPAMVQQGTFREDLYYRLHVFPLTVPPLRVRRDDIPVLVQHFAQQYAHQLHKPLAPMPAEVMEALVHYDWPGNVRELQHVIERAVILSAHGVLWPQVPARSPGTRSAAPVAPQSATLDDAMRAHILDALHTTNWVVAGPHGAATRLGLKRTTLYGRMAKLSIVRPRELLSRSGTRSAAPVAPQSATLDDAIHAHILDALHTTNWVVAGPHGAAARLGLKRSTLVSRMAKLGIVRPRELLSR